MFAIIVSKFRETDCTVQKMMRTIANYTENSLKNRDQRLQVRI